MTCKWWAQIDMQTPRQSACSSRAHLAKKVFHNKGQGGNQFEKAVELLVDLFQKIS